MDRDNVNLEILVRWARHLACMGEKNACKVLVEKPEE
jgi:hypothetical protein